MANLKKINFEVIENRESEPYRILSEMRRFHEDVADANIALAWRTNLTPDSDGHLVLGKCVKATDLQREFSDYDFVILLNREVWEDVEFTDDKKRALIDHELCHAAPAMDDEGPRWDERGRRVWRIRKHDIEEFQAIVHRHGSYKRDLEIFAEALLKKRSEPLLDGVPPLQITDQEGNELWSGTSADLHRAAKRASTMARGAKAKVQ